MSMYKTIFVTETESAVGEQIFSVNGEVQLTGESAFASLNEAVAAVTDGKAIAVVHKVSSGKYESFVVEGTEFTAVSAIAVDFNGGTVMIDGKEVTVADSGIGADAQATILADLNAKNAANGKVFVAANDVTAGLPTIYVGMGESGYMAGVDTAVITGPDAASMIGILDSQISTSPTWGWGDIWGGLEDLAGQLFGGTVYVNNDYNSSTADWGKTKFDTWSGAYGKTNELATVIVEADSGTVGHIGDSNNDNKVGRKVEVNSGSGLGVQRAMLRIDKDMTFKAGSWFNVSPHSNYKTSYVHIDGANLTIGESGSAAKTIMNFDNYSVSTLYSSTWKAYKAEVTVGDFGSVGSTEFHDSTIDVKGSVSFGDGGDDDKQSSSAGRNVMKNSTLNAAGIDIRNDDVYFANDANIIANLDMDNAKIYIGKEGDDKIANVVKLGYVNVGSGKAAKSLTLSNKSLIQVEKGTEVQVLFDVSVSDSTINAGKFSVQNGTLTITGTSALNVGALDIASGKTLKIDSTATITADSLNAAGNIVINLVNGFTGGKIIDINGSGLTQEAWNKLIADNKITITGTGKDDFGLTIQEGDIYVMKGVGIKDGKLDLTENKSETFTGTIGNANDDLAIDATGTAASDTATINAEVKAKDVTLTNSKDLNVAGSVNASGDMDITNAAGATIKGTGSLTAAETITMTNDGHAEVKLNAKEIAIQNNSTETIANSSIIAEKVTITAKENADGVITDSKITAGQITIADQVVTGTDFDGNVAVQNSTVNGGTLGGTDDIVSVVGSGTTTIDTELNVKTFEVRDGADFTNTKNITASGVYVGYNNQAPAGERDSAGKFTVAAGTTVIGSDAVHVRPAGELVVDGTMSSGLVQIKDSSATIGEDGKMVLTGHNGLSLKNEAKGSTVDLKGELNFNLTSNNMADTSTIGIANGSVLNVDGGKITSTYGTMPGDANDQHVIDINAGGKLNVTNGSIDVDAVTNSGTFTVSGESTLNIGTLSGSSIDLLDGAIVKDSTVGGAAYVAGNVTFRGDNTFSMLTDYGDYYSSTTPSMWTVEAGASLTLTKNDRYGLGYGDVVSVYGELSNVRDMDAATRAEQFVSLNMHGGLVQMTNSAAKNAENKLTIENARVRFGFEGDKSFGNKPGDYYGNDTITVTNSIFETNGFKYYEAKGKTALTFTDSVVTANGIFMTNDADSTFTFDNTSVFSKATSNGSDDKNQNAGTMILKNNSEITYSAKFTNVGTINITDSTLTSTEIVNDGTINISVSDAFLAGLDGRDVKLINQTNDSAAAVNGVYINGELVTFGSIIYSEGNVDYYLTNGGTSYYTNEKPIRGMGYTDGNDIMIDARQRVLTVDKDAKEGDEGYGVSLFKTYEDAKNYLIKEAPTATIVLKDTTGQQSGYLVDDNGKYVDWNVQVEKGATLFWNGSSSKLKKNVTIEAGGKLTTSTNNAGANFQVEGNLDLNGTAQDNVIVDLWRENDTQGQDVAVKNSGTLTADYADIEVGNFSTMGAVNVSNSNIDVYGTAVIGRDYDDDGVLLAGKDVTLTNSTINVLNTKKDGSGYYTADNSFDELTMSNSHIIVDDLKDGSVAADVKIVDVAMKDGSSITVEEGTKVSVTEKLHISDSTINAAAVNNSGIIAISGTSDINAKIDGNGLVQVTDGTIALDKGVNADTFVVGKSGYKTGELEAGNGATVTVTGVNKISGTADTATWVGLADNTDWSAENKGKYVLNITGEGTQWDGGSTHIANAGQINVTNGAWAEMAFTKVRGGLTVDGAELDVTANVNVYGEENYLDGDPTDKSDVVKSTAEFKVLNGADVDVAGSFVVGKDSNANRVGKVTVAGGADLNIQGATTIYAGNEIAINGANFTASTVANKGSINVSGESTLNITTLSSNAIQILDGATLKDSNVGGYVWIMENATFKGNLSIKGVNLYGQEAAELTIAEGANLAVTDLVMRDGSTMNIYGDVVSSGISVGGTINIGGGSLTGYLENYHPDVEATVNMSDGAALKLTNAYKDVTVNMDATSSLTLSGTVYDNIEVNLTDFVIGSGDFTVVNMTSNGTAANVSLTINGTAYSIGDTITSADGKIVYNITNGDGNDIIIDAQSDTIFVDANYTANDVGFGFNKFNSFTAALNAAAADKSITTIVVESDITETEAVGLKDITHDINIVAGQDKNVNINIPGSIAGKGDSICVENGATLTFGQGVSINQFDQFVPGYTGTGSAVFNGDVTLNRIQSWGDSTVTINKTGSVKLSGDDGYLYFVGDKATLNVYGNLTDTSAESLQNAKESLHIGYASMRDYWNINNTITFNFEDAKVVTTSGFGSLAHSFVVNLDNSMFDMSWVTVGDGSKASAVDFNMSNDAKLVTSSFNVKANSSVSIEGDGVASLGNITNEGKVSVNDSTLIANKFTNITSGNVIDTFNVSGSSTVKINDLSGQVYLADGTVLGEGSYINSKVIPQNASSIKAIGSLTLNDGFTGGHLYALGKNLSKGPSGVGGVITINGTATFDNGFTVSNDYVINGGKIVLNANNPNGNYGFVLGAATIVLNADVEVDGNGKAVPVQLQIGDITINSNFVHKNHNEAIYITGANVTLNATGSIDATTIIIEDYEDFDSSLNVNGGSVVANQLQIKENAEVNVDGGNVAIKQVVVNSGALNANGDVTFKADKLTSTSGTAVAFGSTSEERSNIELGSVSGNGLNMTASRVNIYNADVTLTDNVSVTTTGVLSKILDANVDMNGKTLTYNGFTVLDSNGVAGSNTGVTLSNGTFKVNTNHLCFQGYDHVISSDAVVNVDTSMHNSGMVNVYGTTTIYGKVNVKHGEFGYDNVGTLNTGWDDITKSELTISGKDAAYTIENGHMFRVIHAGATTAAGTLNVIDGASFSFTGSREGTGLFFNSNRVYVDAASSFTVDSYYGYDENGKVKGAFNSENAGEMVVLGDVTVNKQLVTDSLIINQGGALTVGSITVTDLTIAIGGELTLNGNATVSSGYINVIGALKPENAEYTLVASGWDKLSGLEIRYDINADGIYSTDEYFTVGTAGKDNYIFTVNNGSLYISKENAAVTGIFIGNLGNAAYGDTFIADDGAKYTVGKDAFATMADALNNISDKSLVTSLTLGSDDLVSVSAAKAQFANLNDIRIEDGGRIEDTTETTFNGNVNIDNDGHLNASMNIVDGGLTFTNTSDQTLLGSYIAEDAIIGVNSGTMGGNYASKEAGISIDNTFGNIKDATTFTAGNVEIIGGDAGNVTVNASTLHLTDNDSFGLNANSSVLTGGTSANMWGVKAAGAIILNGSANLSIDGDGSFNATIDALTEGDHTGTVTFNGEQTYTGDISSNKFVVAANSNVTVDSNQFDFNELNIAGTLNTDFTEQDSFTLAGNVTGAGNLNTTHEGDWVINDTVERDFSGFTGTVSMVDANAAIVMGKGDAVAGSTVSSYFSDDATVVVNGAQSVVLAKDGVNTGIDFKGNGTINVGDYTNGAFAEQSEDFTQTLSGTNTGFTGTVNVSEGAALTIESKINAAAINLDAPSTSIAAEDATKLILDAADVITEAKLTGDTNDIIDVNADQTLNKFGALDNFSGTVDLNVNEITLNEVNKTAAKFTGLADSIIDANADLTLSAAAALNGFNGTVELEGNKLTLNGANTTDAKFTGTNVIDANANQTLNATGAIDGFSGTVDLGANELTLEGVNYTDAKFSGTGIIDANADQILNAAGALDDFAGTIELENNELTLNDINSTAAKFTGNGIIDANADQTLTGAGALDDFSGTVELENNSMTLNGVNTTSAEFVGGADAALNVNANQVLKANNTNFDGKLNINTANTRVQLDGDFGTANGNSEIAFNANNTELRIWDEKTVVVNSKLDSDSVTGELIYNWYSDLTFTAEGALNAYDGEIRIAASANYPGKVTLKGDNVTDAFFTTVNYTLNAEIALDGGDLTLTNSVALRDYTGKVNVGKDTLTIDASGESRTTALFLGDAEAVININSNTRLFGTTSGQVPADHYSGNNAITNFNGTINIADGKELALQGNNTTNATVTGTAGSKLTIANASSNGVAVTNTFNSEDAISNFAGTIALGKNKLVLNADNTTAATITGNSSSTITAGSASKQEFTGNTSSFRGLFDIASGAEVELSGTIADTITAKGDTLTLSNATGKDVTVKSTADGNLANLNIGANNVYLTGGDADDFTNVTGTGSIMDFGVDQSFGEITADAINVKGSEDALTINTLTANVNITIDAAQLDDKADVTVNGVFTGSISVTLNDGAFVDNGYKLATNSAFTTASTITLTVGTAAEVTLQVDERKVIGDKSYLLQLKDETLILTQMPGYSNYVAVNGGWSSKVPYQAVIDGTTERIIGYDAASSLDSAAEYIKGYDTGINDLAGTNLGDATMELVKGTYKLSDDKYLMTEANEVTQLDLVGREGQKVTINGTLNGSDGSNATSMLIENISTTGFVFAGGDLTINNSASVKTSGNAIAAGIAADAGTKTMLNASTLTINGGNFTTSVLTGGSVAYGEGAVVNVEGATSVVIDNQSGEKLTIAGNIFGGSFAAQGTVNQIGDASITVKADQATVIRGDIYVSGAAGLGTLKMSGNSYITFTGDASMLTFTGTVSAIQSAKDEIATFDDFKGKFNGSLTGFDNIVISGKSKVEFGRRQTETGSTGLVFDVDGMSSATDEKNKPMYTVRDANAWEFSKTITIDTVDSYLSSYTMGFVIVGNYAGDFSEFNFSVAGIDNYSLGSTVYVNGAGYKLYVDDDNNLRLSYTNANQTAVIESDNNGNVTGDMTYSTQRASIAAGVNYTTDAKTTSLQEVTLGNRSVVNFTYNEAPSSGNTAPISGVLNNTDYTVANAGDTAVVNIGDQGSNYIKAGGFTVGEGVTVNCDLLSINPSSTAVTEQIDGTINAETIVQFYKANTVISETGALNVNNATYGLDFKDGSTMTVAGEVNVKGDFDVWNSSGNSAINTLTVDGGKINITDGGHMHIWGAAHQVSFANEAIVNYGYNFQVGNSGNGAVMTVDNSIMNQSVVSTTAQSAVASGNLLVVENGSVINLGDAGMAISGTGLASDPGAALEISGSTINGNITGATANDAIEMDINSVINGNVTGVENLNITGISELTADTNGVKAIANIDATLSNATIEGQNADAEGFFQLAGADNAIGTADDVWAAISKEADNDAVVAWGTSKEMVSSALTELSTELSTENLAIGDTYAIGTATDNLIDDTNKKNGSNGTLA